jgi:ABC-2 type transport system ATP-binding protein
MDTVIQVCNISKRFKRNTVLHDVSFGIEKGRSYGFVGYNGCGKSVLFKIISGLALPTSGEVRYKGKVIGKDIDFIEDAGVVIESPEFLPYYSGFQNLKALAEIRKRISDDDIMEVLKQVKLFGDMDKKVRGYSQGMKQRLRFAQAIMEKPGILMLDEPTNYLDKDGVSLLRDILKKFMDDGGTLLLTSHNKEDIDILCSDVYEVSGGSVTRISEREPDEQES